MYADLVVSNIVPVYNLPHHYHLYTCAYIYLYNIGDLKSVSLSKAHGNKVQWPIFLRNTERVRILMEIRSRKKVMAYAPVYHLYPS